MKLDILKGTTSKIVEVFIQDSSSSVGAGLAGVAFGDITAYYTLNGASGGATVHTPATMTIGTWASGGFIEKDATNMPGIYQLGVFDAALTGADSSLIMLKGAANMAPVVLEIQLVDYDPYDAVRMGMTSLPNAVVDGAGGLATSAGGATGIDDLATPTNITAGTITTVTTLTGHTAQTGDSFARIGAAGASLTDLGGMSTGMKAEIEAEVTDALVALGLEPLISTTIATVNSQTDFDLTADSGDDDSYVNGVAVFRDAATAAQKSFRRILTHTTSPNKNITIESAPDFTIVATDKIFIFPAGVTPTAALIADAVWDELTTDHIAVNTFGQRLSMLESGTAVAATASTITLDAGSSELADFHNDTIIVITAGTGAGQARFISDYAVTTNVATVNTNWITTPSTDSVYYIIPFGLIPGASAPTAAQVADAVWDEDVDTSHQTAGTAGKKLDDAGAAADPWATALPGAYGAGTAGKIVGDNIDAPISTVDTVVDGIQTDLDNGTDGLGAIKTAVDVIPTTAMRGTDSAALASVCTEARLSELDEATAGKMANQVDEIRTDTGEIGAAGAGLTNINLPNQTMDITGNITGNLSGSVGSVTGAVGSVTGAVGSVTGSVGSVVGHTAQTGDTFALANGATGFVAIDTVVDGIQTDLSNATDGLGALKALIDTVNTDLSNGTDGLGALKALIDTVDTVVDAIKVITDQFVFTKANEVDANTQSINDAEVVGDGSGTPWDGA